MVAPVPLRILESTVTLYLIRIRRYLLQNLGKYRCMCNTVFDKQDVLLNLAGSKKKQEFWHHPHKVKVYSKIQHHQLLLLYTEHQSLWCLSVLCASHYTLFMY